MRATQQTKGAQACGFMLLHLNTRLIDNGVVVWGGCSTMALAYVMGMPPATVLRQIRGHSSHCPDAYLCAHMATLQIVPHSGRYLNAAVDEHASCPRLPGSCLTL